MKNIMILSLLAGLPVFAGPSERQVIEPGPEPCLLTWFAGGSVGYLTELEEPMYHLHLGADTCWNLGGWNVAFFAEVGYVEKDESYSRGYDWETPPMYDNGFEPQDFPDMSWMGGRASYDLRIIPITLNGKLERSLTERLNVYVGAGLGVASVDLDVNGGWSGRPKGYDWVFVAQVFAGLNYEFTRDFEVYGGARWIYFDDADLGGATLEIDDDFLFELGARFDF